MRERPPIDENCAKGIHVSSQKGYGITMRRKGDIKVADICELCSNYYMREPTQEEIIRYKKKEEMLRERGFEI